MIKTVLFDLDGTLLNTIDDLADAGNWVCEQHGWPTFTVEQFKHMVGNGIPKLVERFSPENARTPEQLAATLAEFTARYDAHKEDKTAPYPGIPELLDELRAQGASLQAYAQMMGGNMDAIKTSLRPGALNAVKTNVMLNAIVDAEGIEVTDEECEEEYKKLAESYKMEVEKLKEFMGENEKKQMKEDLAVQEAVTFLVENAVEK